VGRVIAATVCAYHSAPGIAWVKDAEQTIVVDRQSRAVWHLEGAEAVVWDLLVLGRPFGHIVRVVSLIAHVPEELARTSAVSMLEKWLDAGILKCEGDLAWRT